jgi:hypothetical protein
VLFDPLQRHLRDRLSVHFAERIEFKPATLGNDAGIIGAATLPLLSTRGGDFSPAACWMESNRLNPRCEASWSLVT